MLSHVILQVTGSGTRVAALLATKTFFTSIGQNVFLQGTAFSAGVAALFATERFLSTVPYHMGKTPKKRKMRKIEKEL